MKFTPTKRGAEKVLAMMKGGGGEGSTKSFEVVFFCSSLKFEPYCLVGGRRNKFPLFNGGIAKSLTPS